MLSLRSSGKSRLLIALLMIEALLGADITAAEEACGSVTVSVGPPQVPGGSEKTNCDSAWSTCGYVTLTVENRQVVEVRRFVAEQMDNGTYSQPVESADCSKVLGTCQFLGEPRIERRGNVTVVNNGIKNWRKRENDEGTWRQMTMVAYCQ